VIIYYLKYIHLNKYKAKLQHFSHYPFKTALGISRYRHMSLRQKHAYEKWIFAPFLPNRPSNLSNWEKEKMLKGGV